MHAALESTGSRLVAILVFAFAYTGAGFAAVINYDFVAVSYVLYGSGSSVDGQGAEYTRTVSSNLPVSLNDGYTNYFHGAAAEPGTVSNERQLELDQWH